MVFNIIGNMTYCDLCYGYVTDNKGLFVTIKRRDTIVAYSYNGVDWTEESLLPEEACWFSICYGDSEFVAVENESEKGIYAYSTDSINWKISDMSFSTWRSVCYGNGVFVTVSRSSSEIIEACYYNLAYSTDGTSWNYSLMHGDGLDWFRVCYGDGKFVAIA